MDMQSPFRLFPGHVQLLSIPRLTPLSRAFSPSGLWHSPSLHPSPAPFSRAHNITTQPPSSIPPSHPEIHNPEIHNPNPDPRQKTGPRSENQESALNNQDLRSGFLIECGDSGIGGVRERGVGVGGWGWEGKRGGGDKEGMGRGMMRG